MAAWLAGFFPGSFSLVMATGIVSIAAHSLGHPMVARVLLALNLVFYPGLWVITLARLARFPGAVWRDLSRHEVGPNFLTAVAATSVLGSQLAAFDLLTPTLPPLLILAVILWLAVVYALLFATTTARKKPAMASGLHGAWLLLVVATESITVLGTSLAAQAGSPDVLVFLCLAFNLLGWMFYLLLIALVLYRWLFLPMSAAELTGSWWINMGAVAIATLAGTQLAQLRGLSPHLARLQAAIEPFAAMFWAAATFWIPLLAILFCWKHAVRREPLRYDWGQWAVVFPLGMYATATKAFSDANNLPFIAWLAILFFWLALPAWVLTFGGMVRAAFRALRRGPDYTRPQND